MEPPNSVNVLEVCKVAPPPTSPAAAPTTLPLTFFDAIWLRFSPTQRLFFYEFPPHATTPAFFDAVIPKLKRSLSVTLHYFLPLAGNLIWPPDSDKPAIHYVEGDAVSLTIAESQADFYRLSSNRFRRSTELHPLLPPLPSSDTQAPVIGLQVTLFPNVGFCIGIACHHAVLDGKSTAMFMHSWSSICRESSTGGDSTDLALAAPPPQLTPFYDRTLIKDPDDIERKYLNFWLEQNGPNNRSLKTWDSKAPPDAMLGTFHLTLADIQKLKKSVLEEWGKENSQKPEVHLSTFTVTAAYVWACLIKARKVKAEKVYLVFTADCRARLDPPLPSNYFGNCVRGYFVGEMNLNDLTAEDGVVVAAKAIGEAIRGLNNGVLKGAKDLLDKFHSIPRERILTIAGSPRLEVYNTDFGWGKPKKSEVVSIYKTGAFSLSDTRDGINGGVDIGVVLKTQEIDEFASSFAGGLEAH